MCLNMKHTNTATIDDECTAVACSCSCDEVRSRQPSESAQIRFVDEHRIVVDGSIRLIQLARVLDLVRFHIRRYPLTALTVNFTRAQAISPTAGRTLNYFMGQWDGETGATIRVLFRGGQVERKGPIRGEWIQKTTLPRSVGSTPARRLDRHGRVASPPNDAIVQLHDSRIAA